MLVAMTLRHTALLPARPPFRLSASLRALSGFAPCAGDQCFVGAGVRRAFAAPDASDAVVAEVSPRPDATPGVALALYADRPLAAVETAALEQAVNRWLGLDDDLTDFLGIAEADPDLAPLLADAAGLHQVRFPSLAEGAAYFMLTQRTSQAVAAGRKRRLAADLGPYLTLDGERHVAFPHLAVLADTPDDVLARYAGGHQRATRLVAALRGLAALVAERGETWLYQAPYPEVRDALLAIHGIGDFTARAILLRVLGRPDELNLEMAQFATVIDSVYGPGTPADRVRERYGRHVGWWAYFAKTALGWRGEPQTHSTARRRSS